MRKLVCLSPFVAVLLAAFGDADEEKIVPIDNVVDAEIDGVRIRMTILPGALSMPLLTKEAAVRAQLKPGLLGIGYAVGPEHVNGRTAVVRVNFHGGSIKRRVGWTERPYDSRYDGVMGPGSLDEPVVRFILGPVRSGETTTTFRMIDQDGLFGRWSESFGLVEIGGETIYLHFDPAQA